MKAIVEHTPEEYQALCDKEAALRKALEGHAYADLFTYRKQYGYANYVFSGTYTPKLVELLGHVPDSDEIIMLVDGGFNNFGAICCVNTRECTFNGRVNID